MEYINLIIRNLIVVFAIIAWLAGVVLAKGIFSTWASIIIPPYAWYLVVEKIMIVQGLA